MNGFSGLYDKIYRFFNPHWDFVQTQTLAGFKTYLNQQPLIRMWVDDSEGSGHQASTVGILRQLASTTPDTGFDYAGRVDVYYAEGQRTDPTLPKLQRLLPEVHGGTEGVVNNARVRLIPWDDQNPPVEQVNLGLTGGADDILQNEQPVSPNFARRINVTYFLRLQPYLWGAPNQVQFWDTARRFIDLTRQQAMGYQSFGQRAYYVTTPVPEPDWTLYAGGQYAEQAQIVRLLTTTGRQYGITPVYSIRTRKMQLAKPPSERMFEVITSVLASQRTQQGGAAPNAKSVVVVSCDEFGDEQERRELTHPPGADDAGGLMQGGYCSQDLFTLGALKAGVTGGLTPRPLTDREKAQLNNLLRPRQYRYDYLRGIGATGRVEYVWTATSQDVSDELGFLAGRTDRVLFVQLGKIPEPLFYWLMQSSDWPPVFEGQGTANVALNIGKLYYHVARPGSYVTQYPTTIIGYEEYLDVATDSPTMPVIFLPLLPRKVQLAANWITSPVASWSPAAASNPAEGAGAMVRTYLAEPSTGEIHTYFRDVSSFYQIANNDKLRMGSAFLQYVLTGGRATAGRLAAQTVLETLYASLEANTVDGTLSIAPGALTSGGIFDFYTGLLGASPGLVLTGSALVPEYDNGNLVAIVATGATMFGTVPLAATIRFTAPDDIIVSAGRYAYDQRWTLAEIPWIGFRSPFVDFYVADSGLPPTGAVGGTLEGADLTLAFRLPVAEGKWNLAGSFAPPYPGIARFFQLAGGIDLVRSLPAPFDGLAGFGLQEAQVVYDIATATVETAAFRFSTSASFILVGTVEVTGVTADVVVQSPADLASRQVTWTVVGTFTLGSGPDAGVIAISASGPDLVLTGSLIAGVLRLSDIVSAFCPAVQIQPPSEPAITAFQSSFTPATGDYDVSCLLNIDWPISVAGTVIFSIDNIGFGAARNASAVSGVMQGQVTIGSGESAVPLQLTAVYQQVSGWVFTAAQGPGSVIDLSALVSQFMPDDWHVGPDEDYGIAGLGLTVALDQGAWEFSGQTAKPWTVPFISGLAVSASLRLGYSAGWSGRLETTWTWQAISIMVYFDYSPARQSYGIRWGALEGVVEGPGAEGDWTATLKFIEDTTVGSMVETMVSWVTGSTFALEAPWSVLNAIPLSGLSLVYTFNSGNPARNSVAFGVNVGPIELGFARIDKVSVTYNSTANQKVAITLQGSFLWNTGEGAVGDAGTLGPWDASQPGTAPAPSGNGSKYLDLRMLALGQHVTVAGLTQATTIQQAIERMATMPAPQPGQVPTVTFDAASAWLIGADLGILRFGGDGQATGYVLTVQTVFNDPQLYGLRLALAGDAAKVFKGLDFQIMYRQVTDTVGVYQAEITLPDLMRHLTIGAYSLTLPVFAIAVYTNGDFQVDVGFPWNADFSRSFTIEGIIAPGIPVMGSAGFYFGKLSSATTDRVPKALNGTFNPVYVFGFGMQIGFGKSIEAGVLKAGFSVTAVGIIEGVLATFNPYQQQITASNPAQVQDSYYFWLRGTFGIAARLYGSVDFAVIKADVNVAITLLVQITYEAYTSMSISVLVMVDVSVSISINLGLFSIKISFSFSMRLKETFTLDNLGTPPWITANTAEPHGPASRRIAHHRAPSAALLMAAVAADRWQRLLPSPSGPLPLTAWLAPGLTLAHNEWDTTSSPAQQVPCQVYLFLIETVPETEGQVAEVVAQTAAAEPTSFERLAAMVLRWVVAAGQPASLTPEQVDALVVTAADLSYLLDVVLVSTDADQMPIGPDDVDSFLGSQFRMTASVPDTGGGEASATAFPMPPALRLTAPKYGPSYPGYDYTLAGYNALSDETAARLRAYFDQLAVQVQDEQPTAGRNARAGAVSMAQWVQSDYFLLLARQMTQAALDALRDFKYVIDGSAADDIIADVNSTGQLTGDDQVSLAGLFAANTGHELAAGRELVIGASVAVRAGDSFELVSEQVLGSAVSGTALAFTNAGDDQLLAAGAVIVYGESAYTVAAGDSLISVAGHFAVRVTDLVSGSNVLTSTTLLAPGAVLLVPLVTAMATAGATFDSIAALPAYAGGFTGMALATQNAGCPVLRAGERVVFGSQEPYPVQPDDTLADVAAHFGVTVAQLLTGSGVLSQPSLLADAAVLAPPAFRYPAAAGDTLGAVASRFATTVQVLAMAPGNGTVTGLFATEDTSGQPDPWLDIPHLAQYQVAAILDEARRTLAVRQLSRMAARYAMHGTRLPTEGIEPKAAGMWVSGLTLPEMAGLYALTGQQIDVPAVTTADGDFTVTVARGGEPSWLTFPGGASELDVTIAPGSDDAQRLAQITATGTAAPFDLGLTTLGAGPMYERRAGSYPLSGAMAWQSAAPVTLPYGPPPSPDQVQALRLWSLPSAMAALPSPVKTAPRFAVNIATYDEATGGTVSTAVQSHGWATVVPFTIKRVPPLAASPATSDTYEIAGASGAYVELLERIVAGIGDTPDAFGPMLVAYAPDAAGAAPSGLQTDAPDSVTFGIAQVNLSTETRPAGGAAARSGVLAEPPAGLLNSVPAFIRLLWEASITRSGGFYLYYYDTGAGRGLPERIFNDRGEAQVWLIVMYAKPAAVADGDRLRDYMTSVVTGDTIDTSQSVVIAEAAPMEPPVPADQAETLDGLAWRTNSDTADIADHNDLLPLRAGVRLTVAHGVYQAPPGGVPLATIVADFGLASVAELNAANPRWTGGLPDPLPFPVAINLPVMTLTVGASAHTASLADLAGYYGTDLATLAADNAGVPGIFAAGQQIAIPGGPYLRTATVPPGAVAIMGSRPQPDPVPPQPGGSYAELFLLNTFSLLGYQIAGNVYFSDSNLGLPAGPTPPPGDADPSLDKVRVAPESGTWEYRQSFGYPNFAIATAQLAADLPPSSGDPYRGLGSILQVDFGWQDYYGNTLVTTLTAPPPDGSGPVNEPPMLTGYTDPLLALNQWPSVASAWHVTGAPAALELVLTFDPGRYQGLISASAPNDTQVRAVFTSDLDPVTAGDPGNYRLDGGAAIDSATLAPDGRTVTLGLARPLTQPVYVLSVSGVTGTGQQPPVYTGSATFPFPDESQGHSSTVTDAASRDLSRYTSLYYQLTDANGMAVTVTTSLLGQPADLDQAQWAALLGWLFTGPATVYAFLADRAAGGTGAAAPAAPLRIAIPLSAPDMNSNQIYELSVTVTLRRTGGVVLGPLSTTPGIRSAAAAVAPVSTPLPQSGTEDTLGLEQFARDFEEALSVPGEYQLKVASGVNRAAPVAAGTPTTLWAVRVGTGAGEGISYSVTNPGEPYLFAPRPISNELQTRLGVPVYGYTTGTGISPVPSAYLDFTDIDMDVWGRALLAAVDETLTPEFTAPIEIVSARTGTDYLAQLLAQKKLLAQSVSEWMIPLYSGEQADPAQVREAFYQQLLTRLASAYDVAAGIEFAADVVADIDDPAGQLPPRLFGAVADVSAEGEQRSEITLTSPKLALRSAAGTPLPFLLYAPETVNADGALVGAVTLDLAWRPDSIEHQISEPPGITGYLASSWLTFVVPGDVPELSSPLGSVPVPLVLRSFPASPTMTGQTGNAEHPDPHSLAEVTAWRYTFTWSLPFHYVQDRVHGLIEFNLQPTMAAQENADTFPALAEFVTVYPQVRADLTGILARIDATTEDESAIHDASVAVASLVDLLSRVTATGLALTGLQRPRLAGAVSLSYEFEIIEGSVELPDRLDPSQTVTALLITIAGAPPSGVGTPVITVDDPRYVPVRYQPDSTDSFSYYYSDPAIPGYLTQADGQKIAGRTMTLPELQILQRQDSWASVRLTRNEQILPDKPPIAEPFVYTTPQVRFANPMLPTIDSAEPVDIARIGPGGPQRPLDVHLTALFNELFATLPDDVDQVTIGVETVYGYRINQALEPVELPIFLQAPLNVVVAGDQPGTTLNQMVMNWTAALFSWFGASTPSPADGVLRFDLTIMSSLTRDPMPLLRLRNLRLALIDIVPPLPTGSPP